MAERNPEWSEVGDLVIATIETTTDYGALLQRVSQPIVTKFTKAGGSGFLRREK